MERIFDAHFHIINPEFPLVENQNYFPSPYYYEDYIEDVKDLNVKGGVVVSGSYHGYDQNYVTRALELLGDNYFGVIQTPFNISNEDIENLNNIGVRGIRFNIKNGIEGNSEQMLSLALRIYEIAKWHVEIHISNSELKNYKEIIMKMPSVCIDHLGLIEEGLDELLYLINKGIKVKASGFGRGDLDIKNTLRKIYSINPDAMMFGSDLPSTRARRPFQKEDIKLIKEELGEEGAKKVLFENANKFYNKN